MKKVTYIIRMKMHEAAFDKLWMKMVEDTNEFIHKNEDVTMYSLQNNVEKFSDQLCLSGAWIQDRIKGKSGAPSSPKYSGSLTKRIRKALGYNL